MIDPTSFFPSTDSNVPIVDQSGNLNAIKRAKPENGEAVIDYGDVKHEDSKGDCNGAENMSSTNPLNNNQNKINYILDDDMENINLVSDYLDIELKEGGGNDTGSTSCQDGGSDAGTAGQDDEQPSTSGVGNYFIEESTGSSNVFPPTTLSLSKIVTDNGIESSHFYGRRISKLVCRQNKYIVPIELNQLQSEDEVSECSDGEEYGPPIRSKYNCVLDDDEIEQEILQESDGYITTENFNVKNESLPYNPHEYRNKTYNSELINNSYTNVTWKKEAEGINNDIDYSFLPEKEKLESLESLHYPIDYFRYFITDDLLEHITYQSNLYSIQKDYYKPLAMTKNELEQWIGLSFYFSVLKLPTIRMHWSAKLFDKISFAREVMVRDRWESIKKNLHIHDNTEPMHEDKLFKIRPLVDHLRNKFKEIPMPQNLCIDEQMIPFKTRYGSKRFLPNKIKEWGYKFYLLADSEGFIHDFMPYCGPIGPVDKAGIPDLGQASNIVLHLAESIPNNANHFLFFDEGYCSIPLIQHLAQRNIWSCGSIKLNTVPYLDATFDKATKKSILGVTQRWTSVGAEDPLVIVRWHDHEAVTLVSSFLDVQPINTVKRYNAHTHNRIQIKRPNMVTEYSKHIRGGDIADMLLSLYKTPVRSSRDYNRIIFHLLDMVVLNAWLLYRRKFAKNKLVKDQVESLFTFKISIAESLTRSGKRTNDSTVNSNKRPFPNESGYINLNSLGSSGVQSENPKPKRYKIQRQPAADVKLDCVSHFPEYTRKRVRCKNGSCSGKTSVHCSKCKVNLCLTFKNNCFLKYHTK